MDTIMRGKAWVFGDHINAESIMATGTDFNPALAAEKCLAHYDPEFAKGVKPGDILVAGRNFGNSSSRAGGRVLKFLGVSAIVCDSSSRIFFRNTWNFGVPVLECPGVSKMISKGDEVEVDVETGEIKNLTTGQTAQADKIIDLLVEKWRAGGMIEWVRRNRSKFGTLDQEYSG